MSVSVFTLYLTVAFLLDFKYFVFPGDAMSRMANGFYVIYSRDPHLGAIGFVWSPLTSISDIFFLLFKDLWPAMATHDVAGSLTTVLAMTGAVYQLRAALSEWHVPRLPRLILVALFALDPMIVYYGANGKSEALYIFTLTAATRYLLRWIRDAEDVRSLVYSASMLALAFLDRYEPTAAAVAGVLLVFAVTFVRSEGTRKGRFTQGLTDGTIFAMPFVVTFAGWALAGWVLTKQFLPQFAANSLQVSIAGAGRGSGTSKLMHEALLLSYMAPLLPLVILIAGLVALRRRDAQFLAVGVLLGASQFFSLYAYYSGSIFPWFRFYILAAPLEFLLVGYVLSRPGHSPITEEAERVVASVVKNQGQGQRRFYPRVRPALLSIGGAVVVIGLLAPSLPVTAKGMVNSKIAPEESSDLGFIFDHPLTAGDVASKNHYAAILSISDYIANMHLPDGAVITDDSAICIPETIVTSLNPKVFVIPNDRDWLRTLDAPVTFNAHYLLFPDPTGYSVYNAINQQYPGLFAGNQNWARLTHTFSARGNCPELRLFHVLRDPVTS